jgi:2-oxoglutarate dehydrogenase E1 component
LQSVIPETDPEIAGSPENVRRLMFCSGKVYFDLATQRDQKKAKDIAIVRIEEMSPFPFHLVAEEIQRYPNAEVVWCQEGLSQSFIFVPTPLEHMNQGGWNYMYFNFATVFQHLGQENREVKYVGRLPAASPATGNASNHKKELAELLRSAFSKE